jgi:TorA maturation chaperone TorD
MDDILFRMEGYVKSLGGDPAWLIGFTPLENPGALYPELEKEYDRLFAGPEGDSVSLVESTYKPWTQDIECHLSFAREKGLLMGDSAVHMAAIFRQSGVELPEKFTACPDHLLLELEFLSALYGKATEREVKQFIQDHLDWVPELKKNLLRRQPHPFYLRAVGLLNFFLSRERERLEISDDGKKSVH